MNIILNGRKREVDNAVLSYAQICVLAGYAPETQPLVRYRAYSGAGGELRPGDAIGVANGLEIEVAYRAQA